MKAKLILFVLIFSVGIVSVYGQKVTISGFVTDSVSGETVIGASVYNKVANKGSFTNNYGYYSIEVPTGATKLLFSYVGYKSKLITLDLKKDTVINIKMNEMVLNEVVVESKRDETGVMGVHMSAITITSDKFTSLPVLMGEADVIKTLQLLPGVKGGTEGSSGMYVRGGAQDQNLYLLDGTPLYNVNHAFGFFSAFDAEAIKSVTLYKGDFPARFGGRLSSVVDVYLKDGDNKRVHGNASIGLISSKLFLEGPVFNDKTTFAISGRRTYLDILMQPFIALASSASTGTSLSAGYYFYDLSTKISHTFSDRDKVFFSGYMGDDVVYFKVPMSISSIKTNWNWGNALAAIKWNHVINSKLFVNTSAAYTRYRFAIVFGVITDKNLPTEQSASLNLNTGIQDWSGKVNFDYSPNSDHNIKFGTNILNHSFIPSITTLKASAQGVSMDTTIGSKTIMANELMSYCEDNYTINDKLSVDLGLHHSFFNVQGQSYNSVEPRTSIRYLLNDKLSLKAAYSTMSQNIHLLSNNNISLPTDLWVPSTSKIPPSFSQQMAAGLFYNLMNVVDVSLEGYYKRMDNLLEYKDGASFFDLGTNNSWEDKIVLGRGWSYGAELLLKKDLGTTTGWLGYTWAKAERLFDRPGQELNNGNVFPDRFDIRHSVNVVISHKFSKSFDVGLVWVYSTGKAATLSLQDYEPLIINQNGKPAINTTIYGGSAQYVDSRNNYRFPDYHRLDLSFNWHKQIKWGMRTFSIQIYNVYLHKNADYVFPSEWFNSGTSKSLNALTMFPFLPSFTYSIKF